MDETIIKANFICRFKTGDNIVYNLKVLKELYTLYNKDKNIYLLKPIVLINISITEAVLHDFCLRIKKNTTEGVHSLPQSIIDYIRGIKVDEFEKYIAQAKKHDFFDMSGTYFYDKLNTLREVRNRIHIQNTKKYTPIDEDNVYNETVKLMSEKVLEKTLKVMSDKHFRPGMDGYVKDFILPWSHHY